MIYGHVLSTLTGLSATAKKKNSTGSLNFISYYLCLCSNGYISVYCETKTILSGLFALAPARLKSALFANIPLAYLGIPLAYLRGEGVTFQLC